MAVAYITSILVLKSFEIQFDASNCSHLLSLNGPKGRLNLSKDQELVTLTIFNTAKSMEIYTYPSNDSFIFSWPEKKVDKKPMNMVYSVGHLEKTNFDTLTVLCPIEFFHGGPRTTPDVEQVYKCKTNLQYLPTALPIVLLTIVLFTIGGCKGPTFFEFIKKRYRLVLSDEHPEEEEEEEEQRETTI